MALTNRNDFKVYLDGDYYDTVTYKKEDEIYQGQFGYISLKDMLDVINGLYTYIKVEAIYG